MALSTNRTWKKLRSDFQSRDKQWKIFSLQMTDLLAETLTVIQWSVHYIRTGQNKVYS